MLSLRRFSVLTVSAYSVSRALPDSARKSNGDTLKIKASSIAVDTSSGTLDDLPAFRPEEKKER